MSQLSAGECAFIAGGIAQDLRCDGRGREDYRSFSIETGVITQASGSARLWLGATDVIVAVKAELGSPPPGRPGQGRLEIAVECSPTASPQFEGRGGEELSSELGGAIQRSLAGGASGAGAGIDLGSLSIIEGRTCWVLFIDALVLNSDGNLLDAISIAVKAALADTRLPKVEVQEGHDGAPAELEVSDDPSDSSKLDTSNVPLIVTLTKVGRYYVVDATESEESQMSSALSVGVSAKGTTCGVTKRGATALDVSVVADMLSVARRIGLHLMEAVDATVIAALARAEE
eukprot:TRINITY_DN17108_c1_g1_i1.p1 TRINITY_DN17108_c1_g1~~TRINITY_DN17108_c1_g1_i1.p1  ORF type:complete len:288 (-),score=43.58 TRINITY_DN17108_c1_g1_i1:57-920(-)